MSLRGSRIFVRFFFNYNLFILPTEAERKFNAAKDRAKQLLDEAKAGTDNLDEQTRQEFQDVGRDMTLEELEDALVSERAKAEMYFSISPHIVQQYNQRKAEVRGG